MSGMRLPSFFKTRSIKQFEFTPRYYNETKEAMEERKARIKAELNKERNASNYSSDHLRGSLKQQWKSNKNTTHFTQKSNTRILVILAALIGLVYLVLK